MKAFIRLFGFAFLLWLLLKVDWHLMVADLKHCNPASTSMWMMVAASTFFIYLLLRVSRFCALLIPQRPISKLHVLSATAECGLLGMVTPGRLGDVARAWMLESGGVGVAEAFSIWVYERGLDVASLLSMGVSAALILFWRISGWWMLPSYILVFAVLIVIGMPIGRWLVLKSEHPRLSSIWPFSRMSGDTSSMRRLLVWRMRPILATCALQVVGCLGFICVCRAFDSALLIQQQAMAYAVSTAAAILPISIGGLGVREMGNVGILGLYGMSRERALMASLIDGLILPLIMLSLVMLIIRIVWARQAPQADTGNIQV